MLKNSLLEAEEHPTPYEGKQIRQNKRPPWLKMSFWVCLNTHTQKKKDTYWLWEGGQISIKDYENLAGACRAAVRKAKA